MPAIRIRLTQNFIIEPNVGPPLPVNAANIDAAIKFAWKVLPPEVERFAVINKAIVGVSNRGQD